MRSTFPPCVPIVNVRLLGSLSRRNGGEKPRSDLVSLCPWRLMQQSVGNSRQVGRCPVTLSPYRRDANGAQSDKGPISIVSRGLWFLTRSWHCPPKTTRIVMLSQSGFFFHMMFWQPERELRFLSKFGGCSNDLMKQYEHLYFLISEMAFV